MAKGNAQGKRKTEPWRGASIWGLAHRVVVCVSSEAAAWGLRQEDDLILGNIAFPHTSPLSQDIKISISSCTC